IGRGWLIMKHKRNAPLKRIGFPCPCCGFPTLGELSSYDICLICWWEDDGQGEDRGNEVWGGPNDRYSLFEARRNFEDHGDIYARGEGIDVVKKPSAKRLQLLAYVTEVREGRCELDLEKLSRLLG